MIDFLKHLEVKNGRLYKTARRFLVSLNRIAPYGGCELLPNVETFVVLAIPMAMGALRIVAGG